jgi:exportin-T
MYVYPFDTLRSANVPVFRNKLAFTIAHLFIHTYETLQPEFLKSFVSLLASPTPPFHAALLSIRLIYEIAGEIHDATLRSARAWSDERFKRDGAIRDMIRTRGDGVAVIGALFGVVRQGVDRVEAGERGKWAELVELAIAAIAAWTRECQLTVALPWR